MATFNLKIFSPFGVHYEGEAEAILTVQKAVAEGIKQINEANPGEGVVALKSLESLEKVANGQATKIIIPSEMQGLVGMANGLVEGIKEA